MSETGSQARDGGVAATHEDLLHIAGEIDDEESAEILALRPSIAELEAAVMWVRGEGDVADRAGRPAAGKIAQIVDILSVHDDEDDH